MSQGASFCHKCGSPLPPGSTFCPNCGAAVAGAAAPQPGYQQPYAQQPYVRHRHEKAEKSEKGEKREKGGQGGMLGAMVGGLILIWLGITFYFQETGYLPSDYWWAYFIAGLGVILILQGIVIYTRGHVGYGPVVGGAILAFIGLSTIATHNFTIQAQLWPLILVALGVIVIVGGVAARRRVPAP